MQLMIPERKYLKSYVSLCKEFYKAGDDTDGMHNPWFAEIWQFSIFKQYELYRLGVGISAPVNVYWLIKDEEVLGIGSVREKLTPEYEKMGGHIGYRIRKSEHGKGYGTMQLKLLLDKAREAGIKKALITCSDTNIGSIRVIEKNGGVLQDTIENIVEGVPRPTRRYWIDV